MLKSARLVLLYSPFGQGYSKHLSALEGVEFVLYMCYPSVEVELIMHKIGALIARCVIVLWTKFVCFSQTAGPCCCQLKYSNTDTVAVLGKARVRVEPLLIKTSSPKFHIIVPALYRPVW